MLALDYYVQTKFGSCGKVPKILAEFDLCPYYVLDRIQLGPLIISLYVRIFVKKWVLRRQSGFRRVRVYV